MDKKFGCIYKITNIINNKIYIGQRKYSHNFRDKNYFGSGKLLKYSIKKYGKENFIKSIIEEVYSQEDLDFKEMFYIKLYKSLYPDGYNIAETPKGGAYLNNHPNREEIIKKISNSLKGYKFSKERNKKISISHIGVKRPDWVKEKISKTKLQQLKIVCPHCGRYFDPGNFKRHHGENCKLNNK